MRSNSVLRTIILLGFAGVPLASAADFGFSSIIRAGLRSAADWELGIGPAGNSAASTLNLSPYYGDGTYQAFQMGYTNATNSAYVRIQTTSGQWRDLSYSGAGAGLGAGATWTIPASSLYVAASGWWLPYSIQVSNLSLSSGLTVVNPLSTTTLTASQWLATDRESLSSPVVFRTGSTGDWALSGQVAFVGLSAYSLLGAQGSDLELGFGASGSSSPTPEAGTLAMIGAGMIVLGLRSFHRRPRRSQGQDHVVSG